MIITECCMAVRIARGLVLDVIVGMLLVQLRCHGLIRIMSLSMLLDWFRYRLFLWTLLNTVFTNALHVRRLDVFQGFKLVLVSAFNMVSNIGRAHHLFLHLFRFLALSGFLIFLAKIFLILFPVSF